jgi:hypothetical protein
MSRLRNLVLLREEAARAMPAQRDDFPFLRGNASSDVRIFRWPFSSANNART